MPVDAISVLIGFLVVALFAYLFYALVKPERF